MGVYGTGLYSGDFAADLKATMGALSKLPFDGDRIVEIVCSTEPDVATNLQDADHFVFWLVVADQLCKRGIRSERALRKALQIIDSDQDLNMLKVLGMGDKDLLKRKKVLLELKNELLAAQALHSENADKNGSTKVRTVLKEPQAFLMDRGDVLVYPTCRGVCINSYCKFKEDMPGWVQDSWGVAVIVDLGRAFEFLAWYRPVTTSIVFSERPNIEQVISSKDLLLRNPGTCSKTHFKKMELEKIGNLSIDSGRLSRLFPGLKSGDYQAIHDISIVNELSIPVEGGKLYAKGFRFPHRIAKFKDIL